MTYRVRDYAAPDAAGVADLLTQLGYPGADAAQVAARYQRLMQRGGEQVWVAECDGQLLGLAHASLVPLLASDGYAELMALVVDERVRGQGIGQLLVAAFERWAAEQGQTRLRLRSGLHRPEAHRFYEKMGFMALRASMAFEKHVAAQANIK